MAVERIFADNDTITIPTKAPMSFTTTEDNQDRPFDTSIAFIDVEASGLGPNSWPIEVGWGYVGADPRSVLIRPADSWSMVAWEKSAEALHKISPIQLVTEGKSPIEAALVLNAALAGAQVYSDAPDYDSFWLFRLYDAAGIKPNFRLCDLGDLLRPLWSGEPNELVRLASDVAPHVHRAAADVRHLQMMYEIALRNAGAKGEASTSGAEGV